MKTTAHEVAQYSRVFREQTKEAQEMFHEAFIRPCQEESLCLLLNGFSVRHNTSRKPLARLKHSITMLTINRHPITI